MATTVVLVPKIALLLLFLDNCLSGISCRHQLCQLMFWCHIALLQLVAVDLYLFLLTFEAIHEKVSLIFGCMCRMICGYVALLLNEELTVPMSTSLSNDFLVLLAMC